MTSWLSFQIQPVGSHLNCQKCHRLWPMWGYRRK